MSPVLVDVRTPAPASAPLDLLGRYAGFVLEVANLGRSLPFYRDLLGFTLERESNDEALLRVASSASLSLVRRDRPRVLPESATHFSFGFPGDVLDQVMERLRAANVAIHTYHEDREEEKSENCYFSDPDGNRLQLVRSDATQIDHAAVEVHDVEWAEVYYTQVLGGRVTMRLGWHMDDFSRAYDWAEGRENCAPGTRRWDKRYTTVEGQAKVPRPNAHFFVQLAPNVTLGVYLATEHRQEPPPGQYVGTPRVVFQAGPGRLQEVERRLQEYRLLPLQPRRRDNAAGGPYERIGDSLYLRDPGGNFLEVQA